MSAEDLKEEPKPLVLKFGGRLVEQLGAQMYPSATATVAELISNAWDADAKNVWVTMPFSGWEHGEIVVTDDGIGMNREAAQAAYLVIGRNRRLTSGQKTAEGRLVHGRKGIGKLAAFGTAGILELKTRSQDSDEVAFRLDYQKIRAQEPNVFYQVESSQDTNKITGAQGLSLAHGTRIRLSDLRLKRRLDEEKFYTSMSRRFALSSAGLSIFINGKKLERFDIDLQFRLPPDRLPPGALLVDKWAEETLEGGQKVKWWIGFTEKPIKDETLQGISVIVRGRLAQRPFKFEHAGGTSDQIGQEYLVGEVIADWIDPEVNGADDDLIQSNRDQLQLESEELAGFLEWGRTRMRWALAARGDLKREQTVSEDNPSPRLAALLKGKSKRERAALSRVASAVARLPEANEEAVARVMEAVLGAREDRLAEELSNEVSLAGPEPDSFWALLSELSRLDNRRIAGFVSARLEALSQLADFDPEQLGDTVTKALSISPGLLNPLWDFARITNLGTLVDGLIGFSMVFSGLDAKDLILLVILTSPTNEVEAKIKQRTAENSGSVLLLSATGTTLGSLSWSHLIEASIATHKSWKAAAEQRVLTISDEE
jgi:Histidine kinase-, DNA gyrase B-, and HSP90-like ATPase